MIVFGGGEGGRVGGATSLLLVFTNRLDLILMLVVGHSNAEMRQHANVTNTSNNLCMFRI